LQKDNLEKDCLFCLKHIQTKRVITCN